MDWTQTLTIIGVFAAFFIYLMTRMDSKVDGLKAEFKSDIRDLKMDMNQRFVEMNQRLSNIEGHLIPPKVYRFEEPSKHDDEPKEN